MFVIRKETKDAFDRVALANFESRALERLKKYFPGQCQRVREEILLQLVRHGTAWARYFGIVGERDICKYINLLFIFGPDFHANPHFPWAGRILNDRHCNCPTAKVTRLHNAALEYLQGIANA